MSTLGFVASATAGVLVWTALRWVVRQFATVIREDREHRRRRAVLEIALEAREMMLEDRKLRKAIREMVRAELTRERKDD